MNITAESVFYMLVMGVCACIDKQKKPHENTNGYSHFSRMIATMHIAFFFFL